MSGFFTVGETKERPGVYKRYENSGGVDTVGVAEDVGCAVVSGNWGPLNTPVRTDASVDISTVIGDGSGAKVIAEMRAGGLDEIIVVRVGSGGTPAKVTLQDTTADTAVDVVDLTALYPGDRAFSITIKDSLEDETLKQAILYEDTKILESVTFEAGENEVEGLVSALANSSYVKAEKKADGNGTLADVAQKKFTAGTNPTVNNTAYSDGFSASEAETWNMICVDTEDTAVHALLHAFISRIYEDGAYPMCVVSEPHTVDLEDRMAHAAAFNDEKVHYVLNSWVGADGTVYEGYLAAARIAGVIAASAANESVTHTVISGATTLNEALTNAQIKKALKSGCIVLSLSKSRQVWIEKAINTLVNLAANQDAGWKKIRRVKTRYELMNRIEGTVEPMIGTVDNDADGRAAIIAAAQRVVDAMAGEKKLLPGGTVTEDANNPATGDSAWFIVAVDDLDSIETIYLTFRFRFAADTEAE